MKIKLTLGTGMRSHEVTISRGRVEGPEYWHPVLGLLPGNEAWVAQSKTGRWQILRVKDGKQGDWVGDYETAEDARTALEQEVNAVFGSSDL